MWHGSFEMGILCLEINGWVCLPLVVHPTVGPVSVILGNIHILSSSSWRGVGPKHAPGRGPGCKCVNWTVGRVSRFYPVTNLYLILNMDPEYGINLYCQPFRHLINENKWASARPRQWPRSDLRYRHSSLLLLPLSHSPDTFQLGDRGINMTSPTPQLGERSHITSLSHQAT